MNKIIFSWVILIFYMSLIFYFSSQEKIAFLDKKPFSYIKIFKDKILHIIEYFVLVFLTQNAFKTNKFLNKNLFLYSILFSTLYGISDEFHQLFVFGRYFSIFDMLADFIGSCLILITKLF